RGERRKGEIARHLRRPRARRERRRRETRALSVLSAEELELHPLRTPAHLRLLEARRQRGRRIDLEPVLRLRVTPTARLLLDGIALRHVVVGSGRCIADRRRPSPPLTR